MSVTCCAFNDFVKAMDDETRRCILSLLQAGELNVTDIVAHTAVAQPTVSHHLALLRHAHLVLARREGRKIFYRTNPTCIAEGCREIQARFNSCRQET